MSHARRGRRVLAVMACTAVAAAGAGCHSPFHRPTDVPHAASPTPSAPAAPVASVERAAVPELAPGVAATTPPLPSRSLPNTPTPPAYAPVEAVATTAVEPAPTPLLDAALRRAEASEEAERRAVEIATAPPPKPPREPEPEAPKIPFPPAAEAEPAPAEAAPETPKPPAEAPREAPKSDPAVETASAEAADAADATPPQPTLPSELAAGPIAEADEPEAPEEPALTIDAVRLCRKIHGFGSFEPLDAQALRPGRSALVYCELGGLEYRADGDEFVSHVATRVELVRAGGDDKVWEVAGEAEDRCRTRRRDSYVGTLVTLPETLAPGAYTLRLYQADATSGRTAAAEIPVTIAR
ncbi:hypothetical protein [Paludisphaera mucosa]|uniref:Uncharacterized protein n=1 Tax=Paludisphaera mucosa TaxID=3030827 RepID=A0ABT6FAB5_9BACT|nr:hypothetical protein [Paludisphaera mucosa]MDG3004421.1 hypothetical protein [Paludisphaera mucosa]